MKFTRPLRLYPVLFFFLLLSLQTWAAPDVEWMLEDEEIAPSTTMEIRFAREMVGREQLGVEGVESPLVFQPGLVGKFTWLSQRSGVFVPSEAPKMGTTFSATMRAGLKDAAGKAIGAKFRATLKTPPFQITMSESGVSEADSVKPLLEVRVNHSAESASS